MKFLFSTITVLAITILIHLSACNSPQSGTSRLRFNEALEAFYKSDWEQAEKGFLEARDKAELDTELRFRAAFNLGVSYAEHAATLTDDTEQAMNLLQQSSAWFRDAVRLRETDEDARFNLEIVLRRIQILADQLNKGKNSLEARLDRVIDDQRSLLGQIRQLMAKVKQAGAEAEPVAFEGDFTSLATFQRTLLADVGTIIDLSANEKALLEGRSEDETTDQEKVRIVQLKNLELYLERGHREQADARRLLRRLQGDKSHERANATLTELTRAREQLLDPIAVLKGILGDQAVLTTHTRGLEQVNSLGTNQEKKAVAPPPPWLTKEHLAERQTTLQERTLEIKERFSAAVSTDPPSTDPGSTNQQPSANTDPKQQRLLEAARKALPHIEATHNKMGQAGLGLQSAKLKTVGANQREALERLALAIEMFSGLRETIELCFAEQQQMVGLLAPKQAEGDPAAPRATPTNRIISAVQQGSLRNQGRLTRLKQLLTEELQTIEAKASSEGQQQDDPASNDAHKQRFALAETHRQNAMTATEQVQTILSGSGTQAAVTKHTQEALDHITELRRLFFSIIEHLKELARNQSELHDKTATAHAADDTNRAKLLGPLVDFQSKYVQTAQALAGALDQQADAAHEQTEANPEQAKNIADAAVEMHSAVNEMTNAHTALQETQNPTMSHSLEPILTHQLKAVEHIANAIQILQPPQQKKNDQKQDQQQQQQQQESDEKMSQREAERRLQTIREREAERRRDQQRRQRGASQDVEKDW